MSAMKKFLLVACVTMAMAGTASAASVVNKGEGEASQAA